MAKGVDNKNLFTMENYKQKRRMKKIKNNINKNDILRYLNNAKRRI